MTGSAAAAGDRPAIVVAGSDPRWRARLCEWLGHEFPAWRSVEAAGRDDVRRLVIAQRPAMVLVDLDAHGLLGLDMVRLTRTLAPKAAPVALSAYNADAYRDYAIGAGAVTCVSPQSLDGELKNLLGSLLRAAGHGDTG